MKQAKIIEAYNAALQLSDCNISEKEQWEVYKLRKALRSHYEYQVEREDAIREKYSSFIDEEGRINGKEAVEYLKDIREIENLDVELEPFEKPIIVLTSGITCKLMEQLEDFIEFLPPTEE